MFAAAVRIRRATPSRARSLGSNTALADAAPPARSSPRVLPALELVRERARLSEEQGLAQIQQLLLSLHPEGPVRWGELSADWVVRGCIASGGLEEQRRIRQLTEAVASHRQLKNRIDLLINLQ